MGMVNQLGKFSLPSLSLFANYLANKQCGPQEVAFQAVKDELTKPPVLALYDPKALTKVSADASSYGLGAVLLQKLQEGWRPVAFASRSMSEVEQRYAQIEKEALACTWATEKFADYLIGMNFTVETDHKPLIPLLSTKQLSSLPPRVLRFRLRMDRFDFNINHVPGKHLCTADTLSRSPVANSVAFEKEIESFVEAVVTTLPASNKCLQVYHDAQTNDPVCSTLKKYCLEEWPAKSKLPPELRPYWNIKSELSVGDNLLLRSCRIVVPKPLQKETIDKIHLGHLGRQKCQLRANAASSMVAWNVKNHAQNVSKIHPHQANHSFHLHYLNIHGKKSPQIFFTSRVRLTCFVSIIFSRYPEVVKLNNTTSKAVINILKHIFAHHGIPEILYSDNGPQYLSVDMKEFASAYGFEHITSSPHYPRSNGLAERIVKTIKSLMKKSTDLNLLLLSYRSAPLHWCNLSPSELLMGRRVRTTVPQVSDQLTPQWNFLSEFRKQDNKFKRGNTTDVIEYRTYQSYLTIHQSELLLTTQVSLA